MNGLKYQFSQRQVVTFNLCTIVSGCVWVICSIASSHSRNTRKPVNALSLGSALLENSLGKVWWRGLIHANL